MSNSSEKHLKTFSSNIFNKETVLFFSNILLVYISVEPPFCFELLLLPLYNIFLTSIIKTFLQGGWTPLVWSSYKGHSQVVRELLQYGAEPNERGQVRALLKRHPNFRAASNEDELQFFITQV